MSNKLIKGERLKSLRAFSSIFESGKTFKDFPVRMVFLPWKTESGLTQTGFSVSKKRFKNAVDRNRIKRQMREAFRTSKTSFLTELQQTYAIVFIYLSNQHSDYATINNSITKCLAHLKAFDEANNED